MVYVFMKSLMFLQQNNNNNNNLVIYYLLIIDCVQKFIKTKMKLLTIKFWLLFEISLFFERERESEREREINKQTNK